jgi:hypothetical protein
MDRPVRSLPYTRLSDFPGKRLLPDQPIRRRDWKLTGLRPRHTPNFQPTFVWLAATAAQLGYDGEAREPAVVLRRDPAFTIQKWLQLHQFVKQADADRVSEGLRVAGFPE